MYRFVHPSGYGGARSIGEFRLSALVCWRINPVAPTGRITYMMCIFIPKTMHKTNGKEQHGDSQEEGPGFEDLTSWVCTVVNC